MSHRASTWQWRKLRAYVLARDLYTCQVRGPKCTTHATEAGHIKAFIDGGLDVPENLRAECAPCNRGDGARLGNRRRRLGRIDPTW